FAKWYGSATKSADFQYQAGRYIGGAPNAFPGATLLPGDFNGDGKTDILVLRSSDGYVAKWYGSATISPDFVYTPAVYMGGTPGSFPGAAAIIGDFDGNGQDDVSFTARPMATWPSGTATRRRWRPAFSIC